MLLLLRLLLLMMTAASCDGRLRVVFLWRPGRRPGAAGLRFFTPRRRPAGGVVGASFCSSSPFFFCNSIGQKKSIIDTGGVTK